MLFLLTEYCTMNCQHCMNDSTPGGEHASLRVIKAFKKFAQNLGTIKVAVSGGEPSQHPNFLEYFGYLAKAFDGKAAVVLISNGYFLHVDELCDGLSRLQKRYKFGIQVTSIDGLYPQHKATLEVFEEKKEAFGQIELIQQLSFIEQMGRARFHDVRQYATMGDRQAPDCFNLYAGARQLDSFRSVINFLDYKTQYNFCKPMIGPRGDIYPGESVFCPSVGNILKDSNAKIYKRLKEGQPCEKCEITIPDAFRARLGWR